MTRNNENKKMNNKQNYLLALLSAFLMWLAWPPHVWFAPLLLAGLVPLLIALNNITLQSNPKKGKRVFYLFFALTGKGWQKLFVQVVIKIILHSRNGKQEEPQEEQGAEQH